MLNLLAHRKEFRRLATDPSLLWPAFETGDAGALADFLARIDVAGVPRRVDFNAARGNYEARIFDEGILPVRRGSLHDLFNLLAWATFPLSKGCINRIHKDAMATEVAGNRGARRDFLTLVDEAGVIVLVDDAGSADRLASKIREIRRGPEELYARAMHGALRAFNARLTVFGHALFESLVLRPETLPKVGAFAVIMDSPVGIDLTAAQMDQRLACFLEANSPDLHPSMFPSLRLDVVFDAMM